MNWNDVIRYANSGSPEPDRKVAKSEEEWKALLSEESFRITRKHGTEAPHSGDYCAKHEPGKYYCLCCHSPLFDAGLKFESGTGWPSFTAPVKENAIRYKKDSSHGMVRVEVCCNVCDAHLGHVFPDGPAPSGLRFCINSLSLLHEKDRQG